MTSRSLFSTTCFFVLK